MIQIIDLTYSIHEGMFKYPSDSEPEIIRKEAEIEEERQQIADESGILGEVVGEKYKSGYVELKIRNHHGTHIDAPAHKIPQGRTIDTYDLSKFINSCMFIDLTSTDLLRREKREIRKKDFEIKDYEGISALVFYTGFCDEMLRNEGKLRGEAKINFEKTFPYFGQDAANYIINKNLKLNIVGIDSFSVDRSGSNSEAHRLLFSKDILSLETLVHLGKLKTALKENKIFQLHSEPLIYTEGDAAQTRAYAITEG